MDLDGHDELAPFLDAARAFLDANATPRQQGATAWGQGPDDVSVPLAADLPVEVEAARVADARRWRRLRFDAGFGWISGPPELGGCGLPASFDRAFSELEAAYDVPDPAITRTGINIIGPAIVAHGSVTARRLMPPIHRGDVIVCQLFSEPDAGSDLSNIATKAIRDGDEWVLDGQKVWSSGAHSSDWGLCIARTSSEGRKHAGLTTFLVDLRSPGLEIRRIRQMTGGAEFDEVFLSGVRVPDDLRIGDVGNGWAVTLEVLMAERAAIGEEMVPDDRWVRRAIELARVRGRTGDPLVRQRLARSHEALWLTRLLAHRIVASANGDTPGPELAMAKLSTSGSMRVIVDAIGPILGPLLVADAGEWGTYAWSQFVLGVPGMRIGGGTDEVLKNTVAERVLGLPREPR